MQPQEREYWFITVSNINTRGFLLTLPAWKMCRTRASRPELTGQRRWRWAVRYGVRAGQRKEEGKSDRYHRIEIKGATEEDYIIRLVARKVERSFFEVRFDFVLNFWVFLNLDGSIRRLSSSASFIIDCVLFLPDSHRILCLSSADITALKPIHPGTNEKRRRKSAPRTTISANGKPNHTKRLKRNTGN